MRLLVAFLLGASVPALLLGWFILGLALQRFGPLYVVARLSDTPSPPRPLVLTFCLLQGLADAGRELARWADRRGKTHRLVWTCALGVGRHVPGVSVPRSEAEAAEDLIATTKPVAREG
jgi:hypothetical protein